MAELKNLKDLFATNKQCEQVFGIHYTTAIGRGVMQVQNNGVKSFLVSEILHKCNDLVIDRISDNSSDMKDQKLEQEVLKLKLENQVKSGALVDMAEAEMEFTRRNMVAVDILNGIVSAVKIENPDVPQSILASIDKQLGILRNKVADIR